MHERLLVYIQRNLLRCIAPFFFSLFLTQSVFLFFCYIAVSTTDNRFAPKRFFIVTGIERGANVLFCNSCPGLNVPIKPVVTRNNGKKNFRVP